MNIGLNVCGEVSHCKHSFNIIVPLHYVVHRPTPPQPATRILWEGDGAQGLDQGIGIGKSGTYRSGWKTGFGRNYKVIMQGIVGDTVWSIGYCTDGF